MNDHFVHVIFEQEDVDTRTPGHLFKLNLSCAVAQAESESISENLKWLYRKRAERGIFKAVRGCYFGFNTDDGNFTPDENAKYVRQMFQEYVSGKTTKEIAEGLEGVKNNKGKQVSASQVKSILANEVYKGDLHICKSVSRNVITGEPDAEQYGKYIEGHHEAIVGADLWAKAQKRLEAEARPRKDKSKEIKKHTKEETMALIGSGVTISFRQEAVTSRDEMFMLLQGEIQRRYQHSRRSRYAGCSQGLRARMWFATWTRTSWLNGFSI